MSELLDERGTLTDAKTRAFLTSFATAFAAWLDVILGR